MSKQKMVYYNIIISLEDFGEVGIQGLGETKELARLKCYRIIADNFKFLPYEIVDEDFPDAYFDVTGVDVY